MSIMIEIYYRKPEDILREGRISCLVAMHSGQITYKETDSSDSICLTAEFDSWKNAEASTASLRKFGEHVEGPAGYGDS